MYSGDGFTGSGAFQAVSLVLAVVILAANIWMIVDASQKPDWAHQQAGSNKGLWIGLGIGSIVMCLCCWLLGGIAPVVWLAAYRSKVAEAERRGPGPGPWGGPPPGYGGPQGYGPPPGYGGPQGNGPPPGYGAPPGYGPPPGPPPGGFGTPPPPGYGPPGGGPDLGKR